MSKLVVLGVAIFGTVTIVGAVVWILTSVVGLDLISAVILLAVMVVGGLLMLIGDDEDDDSSQHEAEAETDT